MTAKVLITDGEQRAALAVVRSLGQAGYWCAVASAAPAPLAGASRFAAGGWRVPSPLADPDRYATALGDLVRAHGIHLVLPITDASALALLAHRQVLAPAVVPFPPLEAFRRVANKTVVLAEADRLGIAVPRQRVLAEPPGAAACLDGVQYPVVVKPARSMTEEPGARLRLGVSYASDPSELRSRLEALPAAAYPVLLQQRIVGPGTGVFLLLWEGEVAAEFAHLRLREKPPGGGVSVYCESIPADPALLAASRRLLEVFAWRGVAMVEYKVERCSGIPYLMEVNGRFWGSLQLAIDAGVDFPRLLTELALGGSPPRPAGYRVGVRSRWWWGDVDQLIARLRHLPRALGLPPDAPGRGQSVWRFLTTWNPRTRSQVFRAGDPMPFVRETLQWFTAR